MRISTITNWAYGLTVLLTGLSGAAFLIAAQAAERERAAVEQHLAFDLLAENLAAGTDKLTDEARFYAMRGADRHLRAYRLEAAEVRTRDRAIEGVKKAGAAPNELAAIKDAEANLGDLNRLESSAVAAVQDGNQKQAQEILFGPEHERAQALVLSALDHFSALTATRTDTAMRQAQHATDVAILVAKIMLALTAILFLGVLYFVLRRRVSIPLTKMTGIVARLAKQDYAVEVPNDRRYDEIGDITNAIQIFRENGLERERLEKEREADQRAKDSILQMMHRLQACETRQELAEVVACFAPQTFPDLAGRLYVFDDNRNALSLASSWLDPVYSEVLSFAPTACWGLRRGRPHVSKGEHHDVCCPHINHAEAQSLCVPLTAQGDTIGLLYFEERPGRADHQEASRIYLELMSDNIALALANLRLRERLADLAIRDALTGLNNRRSLDEALNLHARSTGASLACIMIDIDHFKHFNDEFGHDAGDAVMQHVAQIMRELVGDAGGAYRFGGEEFTVLLPEANETSAFEYAEHIRNQIAAAPLAYHGRMLGNVTVSLGLAVSPHDGPSSTLLSRADAALLRAKSSGRNRTMMASQVLTQSKARPAA